MITTTDYFDGDLRDGTCKCCNEETRIVRGDGRCPDCIEDLKFYEMTMGKFNDSEEDDDS